MGFLRGKLAQWWHTLIGMFGGHMGLDFYDPRVIACTCGRVFWSGREMTEEEINLLFAAYQQARAEVERLRQLLEKRGNENH